MDNALRQTTFRDPDNPITVRVAPATSPFPYGLPRPLTNAKQELPDSIFERYFGISAKRLEERYVDHLTKFKPVLKNMRRTGGENARQRMTVVLGAYDMRRHILDIGVANDAPSLELAILRRYLPGVENFRFDRTRLRQLRWFLMLDPSVNSRKLPGLLPYVMALVPAFDDLGNWSSLPQERQDDLALAIFALGSLVGNRFVLDMAIHQCPDIQPFYDALEWNFSVRPGETCYRPPNDPRAQMYLRDLPDAVEDLNEKVAYFISDVIDGETRPLPVLIDRIRQMGDHVSANDNAILDAQRRRLQRFVDDLVLKADKELAVFAEIESFPSQAGILKYLRDMRDLVATADLVSLDAMQRDIESFRDRYRNTADEALAVHARISAAGKSLRTLTEQNALRNAEAIADISAELRNMRGVFESLFQPLAGLKPTVVTSEPASAAPTPTADDVSPDDDQALMNVLLAEKEGLRRDNLLLKEQLAQKAAEVFRLASRQREGAATSAVAANDPIRRMADFCVSCGRFTPEGILRIIESVHGPDRVVVLPSAYDSARDTVSFRYAERLYELMTLLVTDYRDALAQGRPDADARHILGGSYRANESQLTREKRELVRQRTFIYEGRSIPMFQHIGIGNSSSADMTIRVHFHWDATKGRIVIGYVGPHLDTICAD